LAGLGLGALTQTFVSNLERQGIDAGLDVFRVRPRALPDELNFQGYFDNPAQSIEVEAGEYIGSRWFAAVEGPVIAGATPGVRLEYLSPRGFTWITSFEPRYRPAVPTLDVLSADRVNGFGSFLTWRGRF